MLDPEDQIVVAKSEIKEVKPKKRKRPQSLKSKGRRLQQRVARDLVNCFPGILESDDCRSISMGASGDDVLLSPLAQKIIPCRFECKNVENITIWPALDQCERRNDVKKHSIVPTVVAARNRREPVAVVTFGWYYATINRLKTFPWNASAVQLDHDLPLDGKINSLQGIESLKLRIHNKKTMKFWPMVDSLAKDEILVFNRDVPWNPIYCVLSWQEFLRVIKLHAEIHVPDRLGIAAEIAADVGGTPMDEVLPG
jgi:hypothetical protein